MKEELLKELSEEQITKIKACKSQEEILAYAKEEGVALTDEQLEAVNGGCGTHDMPCPGCGDRHYTEYPNVPGTDYMPCVCYKCGTEFRRYL